MDIYTISAVRKEVKKQIKIAIIKIISHVDLLFALLLELKALSLAVVGLIHLATLYLIIGAIIGITGMWINEKTKKGKRRKR